MICTYLLLRPAPESLEALVTYYRDHDVIGAALPYGLRKGELGHPVQNATTVAVVSLWDSQDAYLGWLKAPERKSLIAGMMPLLDGADSITGWSKETDAVSSVDFSVLFGERPVSIRIRTGADTAP
ncbi:antibiotic biosynthesis monooxygenase family protein [Paenarthrobacter sp. NPDC057981]|uniref:antibiotic biosynthesis monooxygenase family protein n=1 Tax=Paenarthrobacter sp. NPDC057981 TaxID=3346297 RepID=UPI0036D7F1F5